MAKNHHVQALPHGTMAVFLTLLFSFCTDAGFTLDPQNRLNIGSFQRISMCTAALKFSPLVCICPPHIQLTSLGFVPLVLCPSVPCARAGGWHTSCRVRRTFIRAETDVKAHWWHTSGSTSDISFGTIT